MTGNGALFFLFAKVIILLGNFPIVVEIPGEERRFFHNTEYWQI